MGSQVFIGAMLPLSALMYQIVLCGGLSIMHTKVIIHEICVVVLCNFRNDVFDMNFMPLQRNFTGSYPTMFHIC